MARNTGGGKSLILRQIPGSGVTIGPILHAIEQRMPVAARKPENMDFESALAELESLVGQLEQGELSLEQALKSFERGVQLVRAGQQRLGQAEQQVKILMQDGDTLADFKPAEDDA